MFSIGKIGKNQNRKVYKPLCVINYMKVIKKRVTLNMDEDILNKIDKLRGDINRSVYVNKLILKSLKGGLKNEI